MVKYPFELKKKNKKKESPQEKVLRILSSKWWVFKKY